MASPEPVSARHRDGAAPACVVRFRHARRNPGHDGDDASGLCLRGWRGMHAPAARGGCTLVIALRGTVDVEADDGVFHLGGRRFLALAGNVPRRILAGPGADWILVHDAARPCLAPWHVESLVRELLHDEVGGILAVPVADTLKREDSTHRVAATVPREGLWQAQTPQMFRNVMLKRALESARHVTDEASAIEAMGLRPRLVRGDPTNLKVTFPLDLHLAEWILQHREDKA